MVDDAYNEENDINAYRRAFATILAWEARDPNLPSALLCLKELLIGRLSQLNKTSNAVDHMYTYQTSLSMNIVRFVNFITEPYQKNIKAKPVKTIATEIGLPDWIVNLRHNATHYNLPSIEILEKALDYLFDWIKERYVSKYRETSQEKSFLSEVKDTIQCLFTDYMNSQYQATLMKNRKKNKEKNLSADLTVQLEELTYHFKNETFEILLDDGYLIPTKDQLTAFGILPEEFIEQESLYIPKSFLNIWLTFLGYCNENNLIELLFQNLIQSYKLEAERGDYLRRKFLLSWIVCLLKLNSFKNEKSKGAKFYFEFSFKQVLLDVLGSNPNKLGTYFLNEISKIASFSNEINSNDLEKLKTILNFVSMANSVELNNQYEDENNQMESDDQIVYNMDLFESNNKSKHKTEYVISLQTNASKSKQIKSDWKLIDELEWNHENLKLGFVEGQTYTNLNLDISQYLDRAADATTEAALNETNNLNGFSMATHDLNASLNEKKVKQASSLSDLLSKNNLDFYKKALMANY